MCALMGLIQVICVLMLKGCRHLLRSSRLVHAAHIHTSHQNFRVCTSCKAPLKLKSCNAEGLRAKNRRKNLTPKTSRFCSTLCQLSCTWTSVSACVCVCIYIYMYIYIYIYTYIHTYVHKDTHMHKQRHTHQLCSGLANEEKKRRAECCEDLWALSERRKLCHNNKRRCLFVCVCVCVCVCKRENERERKKNGRHHHHHHQKFVM